MSRSPPLSGWTVVSLRPLGQHDAVRRAARKLGARVIAASVSRLSPLPLGNTLDAVLACPIRIASSPNAVRFAARQAPLPGAWLAIGNDTAACLLQAGASRVQVPEPQTAEGLLQLDGLQSIRGRHIGLLTAPDGRGLLEQALPARGARLQIAHSYRRQPAALTSAVLARILAAGPNTAVLVTSQAAFRQFQSQFDADALAVLKSRPCVASSARLLEYLQAEGYRQVLASRGTRPEDTLQALSAATAAARPRNDR